VKEADTQVIQVTAPSNSEVFLLPTGLSLRSDLRVQARVRVVSLNSSDVFARAGLYLRMEDQNTYVGAAWNLESRLALRSSKGNSGSSEAANGNEPLLNIGQWYTIGVAATGDRVEVLRDGVVVQTGLLSSVASGQIALAARNAVVQFDDVSAAEY